MLLDMATRGTAGKRWDEVIPHIWALEEILQGARSLGGSTRLVQSLAQEVVDCWQESAAKDPCGDEAQVVAHARGLLNIGSPEVSPEFEDLGIPPRGEEGEMRAVPPS